MDDLNPRAIVGGNNPPDPIDAICAAYEGMQSESENWLDGSKVTTEAEMKAVDEIRKQAREWRLALEAGQKSASAPLHDAWKAELARWKPTLDDAKRIEDGLKALLDGFKQKLAAERAEAERAARDEAARKMREAEDAARLANPANIEEQRAAAEAQREAEEAQRRVTEVKKEKVTGLRTVTLYEIEDHRAALHDIASNDRDAITAFIEEYVRRNHKARAINGVRVWQDKVVA